MASKRGSVSICFEFEVLSPQARTAYRREWKALPLAVLRQLRRDLDQMIVKREAGKKTDADIAAGVCDVRLLRFRAGDPPPENNRWYRWVKVYCDERCPKCPHGPYWFRFQFVRSRHVISVRYEPKVPALPEENIKRMRQGARMPTYMIGFEPKWDRASIKRLKTELEKLPADRQEQTEAG